MRGLYTQQIIDREVGRANQKLSQPLNIFEPKDVRLLKNISGYGKKGTICQVCMYPDGSVRLGYFNSNGSGGGGKMSSIEGIDFKFV